MWFRPNFKFTTWTLRRNLLSLRPRTCLSDCQSRPPIPTSYIQSMPAVSSSMSTAALPLFASLPPLPIPEGAEPSRIALDAFRTAVALQVAEILGLPHTGPGEFQKIWLGVESGKKEGGDLTVAVPRFRLKGDPKANALKVQTEASSLPPLSVLHLNPHPGIRIVRHIAVSAK